MVEIFDEADPPKTVVVFGFPKQFVGLSLWQMTFDLCSTRVPHHPHITLYFQKFPGALAVKAVYLDREFYDTYCLTLLAAHNYAYVMPIIKWGESIQTELSEGWSRVIDHDLQGEIDGHTWTVDFPVYIDCTYQQGKYGEEGVVRHGYAVDAPFIETPCQARKYYSRRFGIESTYRLSERSIASTTTQNPAVRFLYVLISFLLQNAWRYLHWEYVASPRRGA